MNFKIPFFTTLIETDLLVTFLLTPFWWISGFSIFIYHFMVFACFLKLVLLCMKGHQSLKIPNSIWPFFFLLISYMLSILMNMPLRPAQRIFASFNNYTMLLLGFFL